LENRFEAILKKQLFFHVVFHYRPLALTRGCLLQSSICLPRHFIQEKKVDLDKNSLFFYSFLMKTSAQLIEEYLVNSGITKVQFCKDCHIHRSSLHKYLKGEPIHPLKARGIENGTNKKLKAEDLIGKNLIGN